jgi:hypothetical protein
MTYDDLTAYLARFSNRTDLTSDIATLIEMAEEEMKTLRVRQMIERTTLAVDAEYENTPADFLLERTMMIGDYPVEYATPEALDEMFAPGWYDGQSGFGLTDALPDQPRSYTVIDGQFRFYPVPDQAYTVALTYYAKPVPFTANATNWIATDFPNVYRFGVLWAAMFLTRDAEGMAMYRSNFDRALTDIQSRFKDKIGRTLRVDFAMIQGANFTSQSRRY